MDVSRIRVVDFETTGIAPPAEVVEVGYCDLVKFESEWRMRRGDPISWLCHGKITPETRAIHHISPAQVADRGPFRPVDVFHRGFTQIDALAAHHADFEGQWLAPVLDGIPLICTYKVALRVWPDAPGHSNQCLRYWLEEKGLATIDPALAQPAHRAGPDAYATAHLLKALLAHATIEEMIKWTGEPKPLPTIPIGKQRGAKWPDVEEGFLR